MAPFTDHINPSFAKWVGVNEPPLTNSYRPILSTEWGSAPTDLYLPSSDHSELIRALERGIYSGFATIPGPPLLEPNPTWRCVIVARTYSQASFWEHEIQAVLKSYSLLSSDEITAIATDDLSAHQASRLFGWALRPQDQLVMVQGWSEGRYADEVMYRLAKIGLNPETDYACVG